MDKKKFLIALPLILTIAVFFALPTVDPDFGWFYRCGHADCSKNTFSVFLPGYNWTRPLIIYPKAVASIFDHFSFWGLTIVNVIIGLLMFLIFHKTLKTNTVLSSLAFIASLLLCHGTFFQGFRNQNISVLFFLLTFYFLSQKRQSRILFIILFAAWANLHPGFPAGLILVAIFTMSKLSIVNCQLLIISFLATLINPSGIYIYQDIFPHLTVGLSQLIAEWVVPEPYHWIIIITLTVLYFFRKNFKIFNVLSILFFAVFALSARRNLPYFYFLFPLVYLKNFTVPIIFAPIYLVILIYYSLITLPKTFDINQNWNSYCHKGITNFPCEASQFLKNKKPGNIFQTYEWGGFLIWQNPEFKVFVDGRMPAWLTPSPYTIYLQTYQTQPGWQDTLKKYKIDYILISPGTFLDLELKENPKEYKKIFESEFSVLYEKTNL